MLGSHHAQLQFQWCRSTGYKISTLHHGEVHKPDQGFRRQRRSSGGCRSSEHTCCPTPVRRVSRSRQCTWASLVPTLHQPSACHMAAVSLPPSKSCADFFCGQCWARTMQDREVLETHFTQLSWHNTKACTLCHREHYHPWTIRIMCSIHTECSCKKLYEDLQELIISEFTHMHT